MTHVVLAPVKRPQQISGVGVAPGRVVGQVRQMPKPAQEPAAPQPGTAGAAVDSSAMDGRRFKEAAKAGADQLRARAATASGGREVLAATALMANAPMLGKPAIKFLAAVSSVLATLTLAQARQLAVTALAALSATAASTV
ncbi:MAG: phosphoenolpyruvate-utilizing N-terminal domain-containing protein, partial [Specibacter sp.]